MQNRGLAHYALKYPRNYIRCRSRGSTSERFCLRNPPSAIFFNTYIKFRAYFQIPSGVKSEYLHLFICKSALFWWNKIKRVWLYGPGLKNHDYGVENGMHLLLSCAGGIEKKSEDLRSKPQDFFTITSSACRGRTFSTGVGMIFPY